MSEIAIEVDSVWKKFHRGEYHDSLRDFIPALARRLIGRGAKRDDLAEGDFWALKDVSFQVRKGEVLGIIGANGAGKSTLLKILAKILKPNRGQVRVHGRLRALIEVAAGFHGDLTGRENIYLNGTILGMKKREIDAKFDQIVEFSGIGPFLDTPVKRYSSGMHARLGFAVAAHLDPEILVVDEVLAVGDAEFQRKCLGKMSDVADGGRTVLFVSHNMAAVQNLCSRAAYLDSGDLKFLGTADAAVRRYLDRAVSAEPLTMPLDSFRAPGRMPVIQGVRICDDAGNPLDCLRPGESICIEIRYACPEPLDSAGFGIAIETMDGQRLVFLHSAIQRGEVRHLPPEGRAVCRVPRLPLLPGSYYLSFGCSSRQQQVDALTRAARLEIVETDYFGTGRLPDSRQARILVDGEWEFC